jgi:hypothetical protein
MDFFLSHAVDEIPVDEVRAPDPPVYIFLIFNFGVNDVTRLLTLPRKDQKVFAFIGEVFVPTMEFGEPLVIALRLLSKGYAKQRPEIRFHPYYKKMKYLTKSSGFRDETSTKVAYSIHTAITFP